MKLRMDNSRKLAWKHPTRGSLVGVVSTHSFVFIFPFIYPVLLVLFLFYGILFLIVVDVAGWGADGQAVSVYFLLNTTSYPVFYFFYISSATIPYFLLVFFYIFQFDNYVYTA